MVFCSEIGLEDLLLGFRADTMPFVAHSNSNSVELASGGGDSFGADFHRSALVRGIQGIQNQIEHDLHQLIVDRTDVWHFGRELGGGRLSFPAFVVLRDIQCVVDCRMHIDSGLLLIRGPAETCEFPQCALNSCQLAIDHVEPFFDIVVGVLAAQHLHD